jgi:tRNA threonylcarbamoyladenosine biosynthesis protein TsaB
MLLLATDTSGKHGSIALARAAEPSAGGEVEVIEVVPLAGGTFSAQLVPQVAALLAKHGFTKNDVDAFVVASGPGSFTGLRVGLAAIKALAEILKKPIVAVSLLEAVALVGGSQGKVMAALDAGRGEAYVGEYEVAGGAAKLLRELLLPRQLVSSGEAGVRARESKLVTSDQGLAEAARFAGVAVSVIEPIDAGAIAAIGWKKLQQGETISPEQLEANYIRRSDAEIFARGSS